MKPMKSIRSFAHWILVAALMTVASMGAVAQTYPTKPIRIILGYPAGGPNDTVVRVIAPKLAERLGQQVVIDNRPGGGTLIAAELAAKSPPDGHTIFAASVSTLSVNQSLYPKMPYDRINDYAPVTQTVNFLIVLVTHPSVTANSVKELIALAKTKPGKMNYASYGNGASNHLGMEMLKTMTGIDVVHVPYKGGAPAMVDILGGQVNIMFLDIINAASQIKAGKLKVLAVTSPQRSQLLPEVPTVAESGVPWFEYTSWAGLLVPAKTPPEIINRLNAETVRILNLPEIRKHFSSIGAEPAGGTPQQFANLIKSEETKWAKVVKDSGAKID